MYRYKILIVDDDKLLQNSLKNVLSEKYDTLVAGKGEDALNLLQKNSVDLVLLDVRLPGFDGIETLKRIQSGKAPQGEFVSQEIKVGKKILRAISAPNLEPDRHVFWTVSGTVICVTYRSGGGARVISMLSEAAIPGTPSRPCTLGSTNTQYRPEMSIGRRTDPSRASLWPGNRGVSCQKSVPRS